jgi:hypothetical protein
MGNFLSKIRVYQRPGGLTTYNVDYLQELT